MLRKHPQSKRGIPTDPKKCLFAYTSLMNFILPKFSRSIIREPVERSIEEKVWQTFTYSLKISSCSIMGTKTQTYFNLHLLKKQKSTSTQMLRRHAWLTFIRNKKFFFLLYDLKLNGSKSGFNLPECRASLNLRGINGLEAYWATWSAYKICK